VIAPFGDAPEFHGASSIALRANNCSADWLISHEAPKSFSL
jgi:hypothetical protein